MFLFLLNNTVFSFRTENSNIVNYSYLLAVWFSFTVSKAPFRCFSNDLVTSVQVVLSRLIVSLCHFPDIKTNVSDMSCHTQGEQKTQDKWFLCSVRAGDKQDSIFCRICTFMHFQSICNKYSNLGKWWPDSLDEWKCLE